MAFATSVRTPGFTLTAILALTLGIGATTAIFSMVNGVVLKPLPYREPDRLVTIWDANHEKSLEREPLSPVTFLDYRALAQVFEDATAWWRPEVNLKDAQREPLRVNTVEVSGNFLPVMGTQPVVGPGFPAGVFFSPDRMALISHRLWMSRFGGDQAIVGRTIRLNEIEHEVVGVMPPGFTFPGETDVWQRLVWDLARHSRGAHFMEAVGRLRPGVTVGQAQREIDALTARLSTEFTGTNRGWGARVIALHDEVVGSFRTALFVLLTAVGLLLLIACINVASLLLARSASRAREIAVRSAIGATRSRLVRQFLTESLLLAAAGTGGGIAFAIAAMRVHHRDNPGGDPSNRRGLRRLARHPVRRGPRAHHRRCVRHAAGVVHGARGRARARSRTAAAGRGADEDAAAHTARWWAPRSRLR